MQELIVSLVRKHPKMTTSQLLAALEREQYGGVIEDIEDGGTIHFRQADGSEDGKSKKASVSGLKDRLSRARKLTRSR